MTTEVRHAYTHNRGFLLRLTVAGMLLVVSAASVTWAWNAIVPELSGLARFGFVDGLSLAVTTLLVGALFEAGRRLVDETPRRGHSSTTQ